jgi:hypothetical protein
MDLDYIEEEEQKLDQCKIMYLCEKKRIGAPQNWAFHQLGPESQ